MSGLIESATAILTASERTLETTANNVANVSTPGFKRQISFSNMISEKPESSHSVVRPDLSQGKLSRTGNPLDLAIAGNAYFQLRFGNETFYSRQGQFRIAQDGTVTSPQGLILQKQGGGDLVLDSGAVEILEDGTLLDEGKPVGRLALLVPLEDGMLQPLGGSLFKAPDSAMQETTAAGVRQGMVEASNVSLGDEMVAMMTALRQAESGARIVQYYDDLIGRAITTFGSGGR